MVKTLLVSVVIVQQVNTSSISPEQSRKAVVLGSPVGPPAELPLPSGRYSSPYFPEGALEAGIAEGIDERVDGRVEVPQPYSSCVHPRAQAAATGSRHDEEDHVGQPAQHEGPDDDAQLAGRLRFLAEAGHAAAGGGASQDSAPSAAQ